MLNLNLMPTVILINSSNDGCGIYPLSSLAAISLFWQLRYMQNQKPFLCSFIILTQEASVNICLHVVKLSIILAGGYCGMPVTAVDQQRTY